MTRVDQRARVLRYPYNIVASALAGITGAWFLVYLGHIVPTLFQFEPVVFPGEIWFMFTLAGLIFGYYIGASSRRMSTSFVFGAALFGYLLVSSLFVLPPFFYGGVGGSEVTLALLIPAAFIVLLMLSGVVDPSSKVERFFELFCSRIALYVFWIHVTVAYEYPMFLRLKQEPISAFGPNTIYFMIVTFGWILLLFVIFGITRVFEHLGLGKFKIPTVSSESNSIWGN